MNDKPSPPLAELESFAREVLHAANHPDDSHPFGPFECPKCGPVPLELSIEHHSGSEAFDFKGLVHAHCGQCDSRGVIFGFTGEHRKPVRTEQPLCDCGLSWFWAAMCERYEGGAPPNGFFDEGVMVGICATCRRARVFVRTD